MSNQVYALIVDLTQVSYLDSSGLAMLFDLGRRLRNNRQELRVSVPADAHVRRTVEVVDLGSWAALDTSVQTALAAVREAAAS